MAVSYTTTELVARIRRTAQLGDANEKLSDDDLLQIADEAIQSRLWPQLRQTAENYGLTQTILAFSAPSVDNPDSGVMRLPARASSSTISLVSVSTDRGDCVLTRLDAEQTIPFGNAITNTLQLASYPRGYCLFGDQLRIVPAANQQIFVRILFERRPSRLTPVADCAQIVSAVLASDVDVTVIDPPPATFVAGFGVDIVRASPQQTDPIADDYEVSGYVNPVLSLSTSDSTTQGGQMVQDVREGDYVCPAGYTCVFPLPDVWWPACISLTTADALRQCGYYGESSALEPTIDAQITMATSHSAARVRKQPPLVFDRDSPIRTGGFGRRANGGGWSW